MKIILFGATGMVGQGVLRECLVDPRVEAVLAVGRSGTGVRHVKLRDVVHEDFTDFYAIEAQLREYDACFFCLGVSAAGMQEADYRHVTYDYALAAGQTLARLNPGMTFIYVSGKGTDSTGHGRFMWARVKGETENALLKLQLKAVMFRPGFIQPLHGAVSKTPWVRALLGFMGSMYPVLRVLFPSLVTTTEQVGRAMLYVAQHGAPKAILESPDIDSLGRAEIYPRA